MITEDQVVRLFAEANPVGEPDAASGPDTEDAESPTLTALRASYRTRRRRIWAARRGGLIAAALVAVATAIVVIPLSLGWGAPDVADPGTGSSDVPVSDVVDEPGPGTDLDDEGAIAADIVPVIEELLAAYNRHDAAAVAEQGELLATPWSLRWERILEWQRSLEECAAPERQGTAIVVHCSLADTNTWTEAFARPPLRYPAVFRIENGRIVEVTEGLHSRNTQFSAMWNPFQEWVERRHPGDLPKMITGNAYAGQSYAIPSDESLALWEQYSPEFIAAAEEEYLSAHSAPRPDLIARAYIDARNRGVLIPALQGQVEGAVVNGGDPTLGEPLEGADRGLFVRWFRATHWDWTVTGCSQEAPLASGAIPVRCTYTTENDWTRALNQVPVDGEFSFEIGDDGNFHRIDHPFSLTMLGDAWARFDQWLRQEYPDEVPELLRDLGDDRWVPVVTRKASDRWRQLSAEFVESIS